MTPEEFEEAGDQLTFVCPSWTWKLAIDEKHMKKELSADKQYISTRVMSSKRIKEVFSDLEQNYSEVDGWVLTQNKNDVTLTATEDQKAKLDNFQQPEPSKEQPKELGDLDDFDDDSDDEPPKPQTKEGKFCLIPNKIL